MIKPLILLRSFERKLSCPFFKTIYEKRSIHELGSLLHGSGTSFFRSKDPKTQNGSTIVDIDRKIVGVGYNGLTLWLDDNNPRFWEDSNDSDKENSKHTYVVHAERNAIYNSFGRNLKWSTLYATLFPCANCAQTIVQSGIKRVIYLTIKPHHDSENRAVMHMFDAGGVQVDDFWTLGLNDEQTIKELLTLKESLYGNEK